MNSKKWLKIIFISTTVILITIGSINYIVDPYGMNNKFNYFSYKIGTAKRPLQYKLPLVGKGNIQNLLIGTSRIGVLDPKYIEKKLSGNTFNLSSPSSLADEQYYLLKYALNFNKINTVIYSLDFMSLNGERKTRSSDFNVISNEIKSLKKINPSKIDYFSLDALINTLKMFINKKEAVYLKNGQRIYQKKANKIKFNEKYINHIQYTPYKYSNEMMNYIKKTIQLCEEKNVNLIIYTPPIYAELFESIYKNRKKDFILFKTELANTTNYTDFSGINHISKDKKYFYDISHLKKDYSSIIFDNLLKNKSNIANVVKKETVYNYLNKLENDVKKYTKERELKNEQY